MPDEPPDPMVAELLRREAFEELGRLAFMAEDYALKLYDAAEERDRMRMAGRLQQLRLCVIAMIQTFNLFLRQRPNGQDLAERENQRGGREDQRPGDAVA